MNFCLVRSFQARPSHLPFFVLALAISNLSGCHHQVDPPAPVDQQEMRSHVVGSWTESRGTNENLQFNDDGTLLMQSPRENQKCVYDFPDAAHIRLDCAPAGAPPRPGVWKFSFTDDTLSISDAHETGTYKRK
jgi:hypothetical protein